MKLQQDYNNYKIKYLNISLLTLNQKYNNKQSNKDFKLSIIFGIVSILLFSLYLYDKSLVAFIASYYFLFFTAHHFKSYDNTFNNNFAMQHKLKIDNTIDKIYQEAYLQFVKDNNFINNITKYMNFADILIENKNNSYFNNNFVILALSGIIAIFVSLIMSGNEINIKRLVYIVLEIGFCLTFIFFIYQINGKFYNKDLKFKYFLLSFQYDYDNKLLEEKETKK
jgi:hypothetical protein